MKFTLTIELGNDAMQDLTDVAEALVKLAPRLTATAYPDHGTVRDNNGNTVGAWAVSA